LLIGRREELVTVPLTVIMVPGPACCVMSVMAMPTWLCADRFPAAAAAGAWLASRAAGNPIEASVSAAARVRPARGAPRRPARSAVVHLPADLRDMAAPVVVSRAAGSTRDPCCGDMSRMLLRPAACPRPRCGECSVLLRWAVFCDTSSGLPGSSVSHRLRAGLNLDGRARSRFAQRTSAEGCR
jgi:hypothetical protein